MVFSSLVFLCIFFPVVFVVYNFLPGIKSKNILLVIGSLLFYAYGEPVYVLLMIISSLINFILASLIDRTQKSSIKRIIVACAVCLNLSVLAVFKYSAFFVQTVNSLLHTDINVPQIVLPIGISFFTFQALSYVIDVYRKDVDCEKSFFNVLLYISFFPQLIAGPIVKFYDINAALLDRKTDMQLAATGLRRFICGLGKKVIISNTLAVVADYAFSLEENNLSILLCWLGAVSYMLQIYYDFSGYSDMAIGLGKIFGFNFKENFNYPYRALNIRDFWRRWHISLSSWFKEYLYIPLGGNRKGKIRTSINKVIVFFCTGLWHGANWTFILWGLYHGAFQMLEEHVPVFRKLPKVLAHIYSLAVVCFGFVLFRADSITQAGVFIKEMLIGFSFDDIHMNVFLQQMTPWTVIILIAAIAGAGPIYPVVQRIKAVADGNCINKNAVKAVNSLMYGLSVILLIWCIIRLSGSSYNPFIYFRF